MSRQGAVTGSLWVRQGRTCGHLRARQVTIWLAKSLPRSLRSQQLFCKVHTRAMGRWGEEASGRLMGAEKSLVRGTVANTSLSHALTSL